MEVKSAQIIFLICSQSTNSSFLSDSAIPSTREHSSASEEETSPTIYQCSCGWEGESFWGETPGGIPVRNHICQRPRAARNLKNTHLLKEFGRTVDHADYFDGFKRSLYKDEATQELVREVNLVQNEVLETVKTADLARLDCEYLPNNNYEKFKIGSERKIDEEVTFSMVEGVSGAQNAMPFTQNNENKFSKRELALLKEVDARLGIQIFCCLEEGPNYHVIAR